MARYDRNPTKKTTATTFFVFAAVIALTLGIVGNYYILKHQYNTEPEPSKFDNTASKTTQDTKPADNVSANLQNKLELTAANSTTAVVDTKTITPLPTLSPLPDLLSSDDNFRKALTALSPELAQWLGTDQLIRRYVEIINDFSQGLRVARHMSFLRLEQPFTVAQIENNNIINPKSYGRYDKLAQALQVVDAKTVIVIYKNFRPLMLQVFSEFSYPPDITLETIIKKAAADILAAPIIEQPINLVRPSVFYKFADPNLEMLSPVQKQMLRMGATNTRIIQTKLREIMVEFAKVDLKS